MAQPAGLLFQEAFRAAKEENDRLRMIISRCAAALPNGASIAPGCTVEFMEHLPDEISACFARLKQR
jgi:hypothetical protein